METTYVSVNSQVDKQNVIYINNGILFIHKKKGDPVTCRNTAITLNEISRHRKKIIA